MQKTEQAGNNQEIFLKNDLLKGYSTFVYFFSDSTEAKISLAFGEESSKVIVYHLIKNVLYREGFLVSKKEEDSARCKLN